LSRHWSERQWRAPIAFQRTVEKRLHPLVDLFAKPRHLALRGPRQSHGTHPVIDGAGGNAVDAGLLDHGHEGFLRCSARLQKRRDVTALAQLRNVQPDRARAGIPLARPITVTLVFSGRAALTVPRAAQSGHLDVHQPLRGILDQRTQKIRITALGDHPRKVDHALAHRALHRCRRIEQPQTTKKPGGRQTGRALRYAGGSARGLLHHPLGHYPLRPCA
jgi:hypothetical protein